MNLLDPASLQLMSLYEPNPGDMAENQEEREVEKKRKRELKREVLEEMKSEYLDTPMEVWDSEFHESGGRKGTKRLKDKETIEYGITSSFYHIEEKGIKMTFGYLLGMRKPTLLDSRR